MAELKKLTLRSGTVENGQFRVGSAAFSVMMNPAGYRHDRTISYSTAKRQGALREETKFSAVGAEVISFDEIIFDGTGVVPQAGKTADVKTMIKNLTDVVYTYVGSEHEPPVVKILWGDLVFHGHLQTMSVDYTLFKPSGDPLRAKVKLSFKDFMSTQEEAKRANRSSPDLSHRVEVKAGDTLPLLCQRIYRDASYYPEVARFNKLSNFRYLKPGTQLIFPPLG